MAKLTINVDNCKGCGLCVEVCPKKIIAMDKERLNAKGYHPAIVVNMEECIGCGMCARQCPVDAITKTDYTAPGKKKPALAIDAMKCAKCGACIATCKFGAISKQ